MRRSSRALAALALLGAIGCQDYAFNPVGRCYLQPGTKRIRLADVSTADILFVVDDSGSMQDEQDNLAGGFQVFIDNLSQENQNRVARGLEAIDFHIAITSTAVYRNDTASGATCQASCGGYSNVCCSGGTPLYGERSCSGPGAACGSGYTCTNTCAQAYGDYVCCSAAGAPERSVPVACASVGDPCGSMTFRYPQETGPGVCSFGAYGAGYPYARFPAGTFVRPWGSSNPRVLHFDKQLYTPGGPGTNLGGLTEAQLVTLFRENILVGICGSGQEQGMHASRLAIEKALAGQQPGVAPGEWPHPNAKLVVVYVGDEEDCSAPTDPSLAVINASACVNPPETSKLDPTGEYANFLFGLGRPLGAAFVVGTDTATCEDLTGANRCTADPAGTSCAVSNGARFLGLASELQNGGADVVAASICAPAPDYFGPVLSRIAEIVKPPEVLELPTPPASNELTVLRIVDKAGLTSKTCVGPAPDTLTEAQARAGGYDWWFVASRASREPEVVSQFVYINSDSTFCQANPGETYSADYLGRLPEDGCTSASDCVAALGGALSDWTCEVPVPGQPGTCVCGG